MADEHTSDSAGGARTRQHRSVLDKTDSPGPTSRGSVLDRWLGGESIFDLSDKAYESCDVKPNAEEVETQLRAELVELQAEFRDLLAHVEKLERGRTVMIETSRRLWLMLGAWSEQLEPETHLFGEWHEEPFYRGYLAGRAAMTRVYQRRLQFLGNVVRSRSMHDQRVE